MCIQLEECVSVVAGGHVGFIKQNKLQACVIVVLAGFLVNLMLNEKHEHLFHACFAATTALETRL